MLLYRKLCCISYKVTKALREDRTAAERNLSLRESPQAEKPALQNQDIVLMDKIWYAFHKVDRFDVIRFQKGADADNFYLKRVVGLPGETIQITDGISDPRQDLASVEFPGRIFETVICAEEHRN